MVAELGENAPVYSLLPQIKKNIKSPNHCDIPLDFREGKGIFFLSDHSFTFFLKINLINTRDRKGLIYLYYGPWLEGE